MPSPPAPSGERLQSGDADARRAADLVRLIQSDPWIMDLLRAARSVRLAEWCVAAGVIRNKVWDHLHGHSERTFPSDIDMLFYDAARTDAAYESELERRLAAIVPNVRWEAVNQAAVHSYTKDHQYSSIEEAMSRWADPVTAVGVRLTDADEMVVLAPHGLDDLFGLVVRPNLVAPNAARIYRKRMTAKRWAQRWPRLTIIWPEPSA